MTVKPMTLEVFSDDGVKAWLNGKVVHSNNIARPIMAEPDRVAVVLDKGVNWLMLKVTQNNLPWGAIVRVREAKPVEAKAVEPKVGEGFKLHVINADSRFEAAGVLDVNRDGKLDIFCGGFWYEAPDWKSHFVRDIKEEGNYFYDFANLPMDVDGDGWVDIANAAWHNKMVFWERNPGTRAVRGRSSRSTRRAIWRRPWRSISMAMASLMFSPTSCRRRLGTSITGMPRPPAGPSGKSTRCPRPRRGMVSVRATSTRMAAATSWRRKAGSSKPRRAGNGTRSSTWAARAFRFSSMMSMAMGTPDIVWGLGPRLRDLYWLQQKNVNGQRTWEKYLIDKSWSQPHFMVMADLDNDGKAELVTGKRYYAHNGNDPGENDPSLCLLLQVRCRYEGLDAAHDP